MLWERGGTVGPEYGVGLVETEEVCTERFVSKYLSCSQLGRTWGIWEREGMDHQTRRGFKLWDVCFLIKLGVEIRMWSRLVETEEMCAKRFV